MNYLLDKIENLSVNKNEYNLSIKETSNKEKLKEESNSAGNNYFDNLAKKSNQKNLDDQKLKEVKAKIAENNKKRYKYGCSKEIPIDECFKILTEHEKKIKVFLISSKYLINSYLN